MAARLGLFALLLLPAGVMAEEHAEAAGRRALPDREAISDARAAAEEPGRYASHRAYLHYLEARRAEAGGELAGAVVHLRQALLYDAEAPEVRFHLARLYLKLGEREKALAGLDALLRDVPDHAPSLMLLGFALRMEGRANEAASAFERAIAAAPDEEDGYLALLALRMDLGQFDEAEHLAERLVERRPGDGKAFRVLWHLAQEQGRADWALRFLRRAVAVEPGHLVAALELAAQEEQAGRWEEAARLYERVLRRDPSEPTALLGSARIALRQGDEVSARAFLRQLFGTHPDPVGVRLQTAMDLEVARKPERALEVLREARGIAPSDPRIAYFEGVVLERRGDLPAAARAYASVPASAGPLYPLSRARAANVLSRLGDLEEAMRSLEVALAIAERVEAEDLLAEVLLYVPDVYRRARKSYEAVPRLQAAAERLRDHPMVVVALSRALVDTGRAEEAILLLEERARARPERPILFALAMAKERAGHPEGAVEVASRILEEDPDDAAALNFVGYLLADHGLRLEEARRLLMRAVELEPDEPAYLDSLGWCELQLGNLASAEPYLLRAAELLPDDPEILHHLAELYFRSGRIELAIATWQRALHGLERDPDVRLVDIIEKRLAHARTRLR
ncbi:MAG TPA: tetratricopeptide repeat protein [Fredinandcohnia sp.]|nr:tetratricopeptide repeat protein [Fredinandcohnia sp.]